jgi:alginate O-acetyltransferase complex protein AlgI
MSFLSLPFFLCLFPVVVLFYLLPVRVRTGYLLLVSYAAYWTFSAACLPLLVGATLATYLAAQRIARATSEAQKRWLLFAGVSVLCGVLALFKLAGPTGPLAIAVAGPSTWRTLAMPLGISYYTFRLLGHLIDVYVDARAHERSLVRFATWVAFFPQIVSGPIQRSREFLPQLSGSAFRRVDHEQLDRGCRLILAGLFQKLVIADRLGMFVTEVNLAPTGYSRAVLVLAVYVHILQIFADFAGYTNLALGIGRLFGIEGPPNFNRPFLAANIREFWQRWHMSLSRWLGDYVFTPLRMRLRRWGRWGLALSLLTTMVLIGLWHRVSSGYLVFGMIHGCLMIASALSFTRRDGFWEQYPRLRGIRRGLGRFLTFTWVALAQLFADAPSLRDGGHLLASIFTWTTTAESKVLPFETWMPLLLSASIAVLMGTGLLGAFVSRWSFVPSWLAYALLLLAILLLSVNDSRPFMYVMF